eukprot:scaffold977_cov253-Pinguiococcus_pyrenoidosus.AAC.7
MASARRKVLSMDEVERLAAACDRRILKVRGCAHCDWRVAPQRVRRLTSLPRMPSGAGPARPHQDAPGPPGARAREEVHGNAEPPPGPRLGAPGRLGGHAGHGEAGDAADAARSGEQAPGWLTHGASGAQTPEDGHGEKGEPTARRHEGREAAGRCHGRRRGSSCGTRKDSQTPPRAWLSLTESRRAVCAAECEEGSHRVPAHAADAA